MSQLEGRRRFLSATALAGAGLALGGLEPTAATETEVSPTEDLMREHGVLRRLLLVYEEGVRRLGAGNGPPADLFASAAGLVRRFVEGYHERLEEQEVFPRLEKAGKLAELTRILREQHEAGRRLTTEILQCATPAGFATKRQRGALVQAVQLFIRMYRPHAAREDTVLFPAFHALFTEQEFAKLGDLFEEKERQVLGSDGFEAAVSQVAQIERALGIYELSLFTPTR